MRVRALFMPTEFVVGIAFARLLGSRGAVYLCLPLVTIVVDWRRRPRPAPSPKPDDTYFAPGGRE